MKAEERAAKVFEFVESRTFPIDLKSIKKRIEENGFEKLADEIPDEAIPTAQLIMQLALETPWLDKDPYSCLVFRCMLYDAMKRINKLHEEDVIILPYAWWRDAVWVDVEFIIKVTNGIIGWSGDLSCEECQGGEGFDCPFQLTEEEIEEKMFLLDYVISSG